MAYPISIAERRRADRLATSGSVEVSFSDPTTITVNAELVETSSTGFRISHSSKDLVPGLEVQMKRQESTQRARVVWTHLLDGRRVSGCVLI